MVKGSADEATQSRSREWPPGETAESTPPGIAPRSLELEARPPWWMVRVASTELPKDHNQFERRVLEVVGLDPRAVFIGQELGDWTVESLTRVSDGVTVTLRRVVSE
jgi:hypothetical protein